MCKCTRPQALGFEPDESQPSLLWVGFLTVNIWLGLVAKLCPTLVTPWISAHQPPLSMGFSKQVYWSGLPFPPEGDLSNPGIERRSPTLGMDSLLSEPPGKPKNT